jgi:hypothetical protein
MPYDAAKQHRALATELRPARKVAEALDRWVAMPGHFFGPTPEQGSEVGDALAEYHQTPKAVLDHQPSKETT